MAATVHSLAWADQLQALLDLEPDLLEEHVPQRAPSATGPNLREEINFARSPHRFDIVEKA